MIGKLFDKILEEGREIEEEISKEMEKRRRFTWKDVLPPILLFLLALGARLVFMFLTDPQNPGYAWYGDVYHHWQIAYLSKTVGFQHGFLRLWDLKGMEYFWGLLHPLASVFLFTITGSVDIILIRLLSIVPSSLVIVFIFLLVKRDFNASAAWASALFLALFPITLFSDTIGMQEPLGLALLFGGILAWPRYGWLTGFLWGLASMERAEYWLFTIALVIAAFLDKSKKANSEAKIGLLFSWLIVIVFYMKYLATWTSNYIYPIYWNFLASVIGQWFKKGANPYLPADYFFQAKILFRFAFLFGLIAILWLLKQRRRYYLWFLLGFFNVCFIGFMFGFAAYSWGYMDRFWIDRLLAWPYGFLGILLSIFLLYFLPKKFKLWHQLKLGWLIWLVGFAASMLIWKPISYYFTIAQLPWKGNLLYAQKTAEFWNRKGRVLVPENMPAFVYALVRNEGVKGEQIISQKYDAFAYLEEDPFENWPETWPKIKAWLDKENITLIVTPNSRVDYLRLYDLQPKDFKLLGGFAELQFYQPTWKR